MTQKDVTDTQTVEKPATNDVRRSLVSGIIQLTIFAAASAVVGLIYNFGEEAWQSMIHFLTLGGFWGATGLVSFGVFTALAAANHVERADGLSPLVGVVFFLAYACMGLGRVAMCATYETTDALTPVQSTANAATWVAVVTALAMVFIHFLNMPRTKE